MGTKTQYLYIDKEAVATLAMVKDELLLPVTGLMNEKESEKVDEEGKYNGQTFPFSFILAPAGKTNELVLKTAKKGEKLIFVCDNEICGHIIVDEVFPIDKDKRIQRIYGTNNPEHPGVKDTYKRLGALAVCGEYEVDFNDIKDHKRDINETIKKT